MEKDDSVQTKQGKGNPAMDFMKSVLTPQDMVQAGLNSDKNSMWSFAELFPNGKKPELTLTGIDVDEIEDVTLSDIPERYLQKPHSRKRAQEVFDDDEDDDEERPSPQRKARKIENQSRPKNQPLSKKQCVHCKGHHPPLKCVVMEGFTGMVKICPIHPHMKNHYLDTCTSLYDWISKTDLLDALWTFMGPGRHGLPPIYSGYIDIYELTRYLRKSWAKLPCSVDHARLMGQTHRDDLSKPMDYKERPPVPWFNEKVQPSQTEPQTAKRQPPEHGDIHALRAYLVLNLNKPTPRLGPNTGPKTDPKPETQPQVRPSSAAVDVFPGMYFGSGAAPTGPVPRFFGPQRNASVPRNMLPNNKPSSSNGAVGNVSGNPYQCSSSNDAVGSLFENATQYPVDMDFSNANEKYQFTGEQGPNGPRTDHM